MHAQSTSADVPRAAEARAFLRELSGQRRGAGAPKYKCTVRVTGNVPALELYARTVCRDPRSTHSPREIRPLSGFLQPSPEMTDGGTFSETVVLLFTFTITLIWGDDGGGRQAHLIS